MWFFPCWKTTISCFKSNNNLLNHARLCDNNTNDPEKQERLRTQRRLKKLKDKEVKKQQKEPKISTITENSSNKRSSEKISKKDSNTIRGDIAKNKQKAGIETKSSENGENIKKNKKKVSSENINNDQSVAKQLRSKLMKRIENLEEIRMRQRAEAERTGLNPPAVQKASSAAA